MHIYADLSLAHRILKNITENSFNALSEERSWGRDKKKKRFYLLTGSVR